MRGWAVVALLALGAMAVAGPARAGVAVADWTYDFTGGAVFGGPMQTSNSPGLSSGGDNFVVVTAGPVTSELDLSSPFSGGDSCTVPGSSCTEIKLIPGGAGGGDLIEVYYASGTMDPYSFGANTLDTPGTYYSGPGTDGTLVINNGSNVPEPLSLATFGAGLLATALLRRRR